MQNSRRWRCGIEAEDSLDDLPPATHVGERRPWNIGNSSERRRVRQTTINALLVAESQRWGRNFATRLERLGCKCWVATTREEVRVLLRQRPFRLVLSTRPVTDRGPLMELLKDSERVVFYSLPVADKFLWFQALPELVDGEVPQPLRPRDLMSVLDELIARWRPKPSRAPLHNRLEIGVTRACDPALEGQLRDGRSRKSPARRKASARSPH